MPIKIELFGSALKISLIKFKFSWVPPLQDLLLYPPLNKGVFGICTGSSESREKYFQKKGVKRGYSLKSRKKNPEFFKVV